MKKDVDPAKIVEQGYDDIALAYHEQRDKYKNNELLTAFSALLLPGADVLDVGCGAGVPVAQYLVGVGFWVTGVDVSSRMLALARIHVPEAKFVKMDMRQLGFAASSFDGICAFYSLFHVPREDHLRVLRGFNRLLRPGGILLFSSGRNEWQGTKNYHGAEMFWSHPDREATQQLVIDAGFSVEMSEVQELGGEKQYWVMAKRQA